MMNIKEKIVNGFKAIIENEGPFYIPCLEGKDRTGFVCLLLECLADFNLEELEKDYMTTYLNYFGISRRDNERYIAIKELYFDAFIEYLDIYSNGD